MEDAFLLLVGTQAKRGYCTDVNGPESVDAASSNSRRLATACGGKSYTCPLLRRIAGAHPARGHGKPCHRDGGGGRLSTMRTPITGNLLCELHVFRQATTGKIYHRPR